MNPDQIEHPSHGGSYLRNADGSLTLVEQTAPANAAPAAAAPESAAAAVPSTEDAVQTSARGAD